MTDAKEGATENAESLLKRVLERLGEAVDKKVGTSAGSANEGLPANEIARLETILERSIDAAVVKDAARGVNIAPGVLQVMLTHESAAGLGKTYMTALEEELRLSALEFITNRRYYVDGAIRVFVTVDVLAKTSSVKASFAGRGSNAEATGGLTQAPTCVVELRSGDATYRTKLAASAPPANIGRLASSAIFVDHPSISRLHASLALNSDRGVVISDLGSANGTSVNGGIVNSGEAREVAAGDVLTVGDVHMTVSKIDFSD